MRIGRFDFGIRKYGRKFKWFYHPLLKSNEEQFFVFFVWIGWHFYACLRRKRYADCKITFRMPLPEPPKEDKDGE